jgi:hypothetical protein
LKERNWSAGPGRCSAVFSRPGNTKIAQLGLANPALREFARRSCHKGRRVPCGLAGRSSCRRRCYRLPYFHKSCHHLAWTRAPYGLGPSVTLKLCNVVKTPAGPGGQYMPSTGGSHFEFGAVAVSAAYLSCSVEVSVRSLNESAQAPRRERMASGERSQALYSKGFVRRHHQGHQAPHILFEARPEETGQAGARSQTRSKEETPGQRTGSKCSFR